MVIRPALSDDAHGVAVVHVASWQAAYRGIVPSERLDTLSVAERAARWLEILQEEEAETIVAESSSGEVIGFSSFGKSRDSDAAEDTGEVRAIYVAPEHWSTGVGAALWRSSIERLKQLGYAKVTLWVLVANERAIQFYQRAGLQCCDHPEVVVKIGGKELPEARYAMVLD